MRTCTKCHVEKSDTEFYWTTYQRFDSQCKECRKAYQRARAKSLAPGRQHGWNRASLLRRYGMTLEQYDDMLERQGGGCALCGKKAQPSGHALSVDHCHRTGKVRGILCKGCNSMLAGLDDPEWRARAEEYLGT